MEYGHMPKVFNWYRNGFYKLVDIPIRVIFQNSVTYFVTLWLNLKVLFCNYKLLSLEIFCDLVFFPLAYQQFTDFITKNADFAFFTIKTLPYGNHHWKALAVRKVRWVSFRCVICAAFWAQKTGSVRRQMDDTQNFLTPQ